MMDSSLQVMGFNITIVTVNILLSFILGYSIAYLYKFTHKGLSYSQSFTYSLVILSTIACVAIMVVGNSLARAFGLAGALTIIRFRTVLKDPKDIAFIFWSLVIGIACGTKAYPIAIIGTGLISLIILLLSKANFGSIRKHDYILRFNRNIKKLGDDVIQRIFEKYLKSCILQVMVAHKKGEVFEFSYNVHFFDKNQQHQLVQELSQLDGIERVHILTASNDIDY